MQRRISLEGCHNFRDLGGYPTADGRRVRWRRLFRADGLQDLTPADVKQLTGEIGLSDVVDLRSTAELELDGRGRLQHESRVRFHHLPLFDAKRNPTAAAREVAGIPASRKDWTLAQMYLGILENARAPIARVIAALAEANGAAVFHCAAGKDRTGVISALLLALLDVPEEIIVADYAATRETLDLIVARLNRSRGYDRVWEALPPDTLHAEPKTMRDFLAGLRTRYGGARGYARAIGLSDALLARLAQSCAE
jgi:protein-tyrosine phosphatase